MEALLEQEAVLKLLKCSQSHLDRERRAGRITCVRMGRKIRYEPEEVRRFVESQRVTGGGR